MTAIIFATANQRKITEARAALGPYEITIEPLALTIDEIQHHDPAEIAKAKARAAYASAHQPIVVSDTSWSIPALGGFPGGYMKDISAWLKDSDWLSLMRPHTDRTILCHEHVAYFDGTTLQHFVSTYTGTMTQEPRGRVVDDESFERVTVLYGNKTMAEQLESGDIASAGEELLHWKQFAQWYQQR